MAVIYYVEHGDTKYDAEDCSQGTLDEGLTDVGKRQARHAAASLKGTKIDCVYCSPMKRARETAGIIAKTLGAKIIVLPKLKPLDIGTLAGKKNSTVAPYLDFFFTRPTLPFPQGEKFGDYYERVRKEWTKQFADDDPEIAVVAHGRDWQLLKYWQKSGMDAGPEGVKYLEPASAQVSKITKSGNSIDIRRVA